eukprot:COSAG01_NODE_6800_length_3493_cov_8.005009_4_plen_178_part_00
MYSTVRYQCLVANYTTFCSPSCMNVLRAVSHCVSRQQGYSCSSLVCTALFSCNSVSSSLFFSLSLSSLSIDCMHASHFSFFPLSLLSRPGYSCNTNLCSRSIDSAKIAGDRTIDCMHASLSGWAVTYEAYVWSLSREGIFQNFRFRPTTSHSTRHLLAMPMALSVFAARQFSAEKLG